jgi:hypothetical protein
VAAQDRVGEIGGGLLVEPAKLQRVRAERIFSEPVFLAARTEQDERAPGFQDCEQASQIFLFRLGERVLDGKGYAFA